MGKFFHKCAKYLNLAIFGPLRLYTTNYFPIETYVKSDMFVLILEHFPILVDMAYGVSNQSYQSVEMNFNEQSIP